MKKVIAVFTVVIVSAHVSLYGQCPTPITSTTTISSPCSGNIVVSAANIILTINAAVTGNVTIDDQQTGLVIGSTGSISGSLTVNDQQTNLEVNGTIQGNLDINSQQVTLQLSGNINGTLGMGDQQVDIDVVGNSTIGSVTSSGQQNDFVVDNSNNSVPITLNIQNDVCIGDQQNSIVTGADDIVNIFGTVKCTGSGCSQMEFTGNVNAAACNAESGNFCNDADLTIDASLPIELLSFSLGNIGRVVEINWSTASEENNDFFTIQRSHDAETFEEIGTIKGAGNSSEIIEYRFVDTDPIAGLSYYRLRQTDFDGKFEIFNAVAVFVEANDDFKVYPTLLKGNILYTNYLQPGGKEAVKARIIDLYGRVEYEFEVNDGSIEVPYSVADGVYFVEIDNLGVSTRSRIYVNR